VIYSEAGAALRAFAEATGIPVADTQAGKGAIAWDHPCAVGGVGATGSPVANALARDADVILGVGTRYSDFTTASRTAFQNPDVRFVNLNITSFDAAKQSATALVADAREGLTGLTAALTKSPTRPDGIPDSRESGYRVAAEYTAGFAAHREEWTRVVDRAYHLDHGPLPAQTEVLGALNELMQPRDVIVQAAGSMPGDLQMLWRASDEKAYHVEYGYSCMGYEIAGALGVKMAAMAAAESGREPDREVFALVGDGSYLMMAQEIATAVQERLAITIVVFDNQGYASIGGLSASVGSGGFGTRYRRRNAATGELDGDLLTVDFVANAASMGARACRADTLDALRSALVDTNGDAGPQLIVVPVDREARVGGYESWWDVPVAAVSTMTAVRDARTEFETARQRERDFL
jgi:3D-(3,5/4)-trihydroxycyclohexane-1,2-dione acylhydrolase (decyclizing)